MEHSYKILGSYDNQAGLVDLQYSLNTLRSELYELIQQLQNFFVPAGLKQFEGEQVCLLKMYDTYVLIRFQDRFTTPSASREYHRIEIHFLPEDKFKSWQHVGEFIKLNPLKQIAVGESIEFVYPRFKKNSNSEYDFELVKKIYQAVICNKTFLTTTYDLQFDSLLQLLDSNNVFHELFISAYNVNEDNFRAFSNTNLCVYASHVEKTNDPNTLILEVINKLATRLNTEHISSLKNHREYYKRAAWLLQFEYCNEALENLIHYAKTESKNKIDRVFDLCNSLFEEASFLFEDNFKERLASLAPYYYKTHKHLLEKVLQFDRKSLSHIPVETLAKHMVDDNSIQKAFSEYLFLKRVNQEAFNTAVLEIAWKNEKITENKDEIFDLILKDHRRWMILNHLSNLSEAQVITAFSQIKDEDFEIIKPTLETVNDIEHLNLTAKEGEDNKISYLRNKILASAKYPFSKLYAFNQFNNDKLSDIVFEKNPAEIEFKKGEIKSYMQLFKNAGREKQLFERSKTLGTLKFSDRCLLNKLKIQSIKSDYPIIRERLKKHQMVFWTLIALLIISISILYVNYKQKHYLANQNKQLNNKQQTLKKRLDSINANYVRDTFLLRDSLRKIKTK